MRPNAGISTASAVSRGSTHVYYFRYDIQTASDLRYYAIPDLQSRLKQLEEKEALQEAASGETDAVTPEKIAEIVARWTSIPITKLVSTEKEKLLKLDKLLSETVVGQPEAVKAVANAIRLSRSGLANPGRPIASFLMAGPSGTGKTLLTKTVSTVYFHFILGSDRLIACICSIRLAGCHDPHRWFRIF